jgi:hypothetical protein
MVNGAKDWYKDPQYLELSEKPLEQGEAAVALREAWKRVYNKYPSDESLALLWSQSALETGRWKKIRNYNFGNIKKRHANPKYKVKDDTHYFTMFRCNEVLKGKLKWFDPPHIQTHFRAYKTVIDGAEDYIVFVSKKKRYTKAWEQVLKGDPKAYSQELKKAGYYTASEEKYTKGVVSLTNEFLRKKETLLAWKDLEAADTDPSGSPSSDPKPLPPIPPAPPVPSDPILIPIPNPDINYPDDTRDTEPSVLNGKTKPGMGKVGLGIMLAIATAIGYLLSLLGL